MLVSPERDRIFLEVPRTGSRAMREVLFAHGWTTSKHARHRTIPMERGKCFCVFREPVARLRSLRRCHVGLKGADFGYDPEQFMETLLAMNDEARLKCACHPQRWWLQLGDRLTSARYEDGLKHNAKALFGIDIDKEPREGDGEAMDIEIEWNERAQQLALQYEDPCPWSTAV